MNRRHRSMAGLVLAFALCSTGAPRQASGSCLALSKDPSFVDCRAVIAPPFTLGTLYVLASLFADAAVDGITGAEFRIDGFPAGWFVSAAVNPAWTATGDPLGDGCSVALPACEGGPGTSHIVPIQRPRPVRGGCPGLVDIYLNKNRRTALLDCVVVEQGRAQNFFVQLSQKDRQITVRLLPATDPEKTVGVKRLMGIVASNSASPRRAAASGRPTCRSFSTEHGGWVAGRTSCRAFVE